MSKGRSVEELVSQLRDDDRAHAEGAVEELIAVGKEAVGPVTDVLRSGPAHSRAAAAWILGSIGDTSAGDALWRALDDPDELVRARAATALSWLSDPRAVDALMRTLEDAQDILHAFHTLSAYELVNRGPEVVPRLVAELPRRDVYGQMVTLTVLGRIADAARATSPDMASLADIMSSFDPIDTGEGLRALVARVGEWGTTTGTVT